MNQTTFVSHFSGIVMFFKDLVRTVGRTSQAADTGSLNGSRSTPCLKETEMAHKKVPAASFSKKLTAAQHAKAMALLRDRSQASKLHEVAKRRVDKAFGHDPKSETEVEDFGKKAH